MDNVTLAYLAGAIDSDGTIGIKRSTYHRRVRKDASNPVFSERICLKQVTPQIPTLLHETFGGGLRLDKLRPTNNKPLWSWAATDKKAARAALLLHPYLRIKRQQAELLLELRESKTDHFRQLAYWFAKENPDWQTMPMVTAREAAVVIGYKNVMMVYQVVGNNSLLALPVLRGRAVETRRFPLPFVEAYAAFGKLSSSTRGRLRPPQLIAWRERLFGQIRSLNTIGVNGTKVTRREGVHAPIPD